MRDSLMLSSLTVGEKQHPRLGGCVRVFFQLFDWNRRLSCKKRIFSLKQLPAEWHTWRAFSKAHAEEVGGETSASNADADQVYFITNGEEEDNLQLKLEQMSCSHDKEEQIMRGEDMNDGVVHEAVASPAGFCSGKESIQESAALLVKSPGVIGKLMGLDSLPSPSTPPCEIKQKGSPPHTCTPFLFPSIVIPPHDHDLPNQLALHLGLPDEELNALLSELNGNMCSFSANLPPHVGFSSRKCPSTSATPPHSPSTTRGALSSTFSCATSLVAHTKANATSVPSEASSPSNCALTKPHDVELICPPTTPRKHSNLTSSPVSDFPDRRTNVNAANVPVSAMPLALNAYEERAYKPYHVKGAQAREAQSREEQLMLCTRNDFSELGQESMKCARPNGGESIKEGKKVKAKAPISKSGEKGLSQKGVSAGISYGASMDINVPCSPQELQDVGRTTCKPVRRRKKVDTPMQQRLLQEEDVKVGSNSAGLASINAASESNSCMHDDCLPPSNFAIHYNVGFFDEYHKSRATLTSACKSKHTVVEKAYQNKAMKDAVADHNDQICSTAAAISSSAAAKEDQSSFIGALIKRRAVREAATTAAAATAATEAADLILRTALPDTSPGLPAAMGAARSVDTLQSMISSCSIETHNDPNRREKLSAGRSEAGGGDFIQVLHPITYSTGAERRRAAADACCVSTNRNCEEDGAGMQAGMIGDSNNDGGVKWCANSGMGSADGVHRGMCMASSISVASLACTKEGAGGGTGVQVDMCGTSHSVPGKNTTAAMLQDVISALNGSALCTPVSAARRRRHHQHHRHLFSDDDGSAPSTADGNDTESTSESGSCWAAASQPSPVSVLIPPFDDDVSPAGDEACWIQSEEDYVLALLAATSENGKTSLPPAELFGKLEERVIAAWPDSEVAPTRSYRRLVFDCVCEALGQAVALKGSRGNRRKTARVLFEEMCRWRHGGCEIVLDDLVEAELRKACNRWLAFEVQTREIAVRLERTILGLLVEELVCDLVLS